MSGAAGIEDALEDFARDERSAASEVAAAREIAAAIERGLVVSRPMTRCLIEHAFDLLCAGSPRPGGDAWSLLREDADFWADTAPQQEIEAYVAAGLRELERRELAPRLRKRLLKSLWLSMPWDWQRDFLARVDPEGRWIGGGA